MPDGYNGWTNHETWNVALWIDNDQSAYSWRCGVVEDAIETASIDRYCDDLEDFTRDIALSIHDTVKDYVEECNPLAEGVSMFCDLLNTALSEVDYYEIAENWLSDMKGEIAAKYAELVGEEATV